MRRLTSLRLVWHERRGSRGLTEGQKVWASNLPFVPRDLRAFQASASRRITCYTCKASLCFAVVPYKSKICKARSFCIVRYKCKALRAERVESQSFANKAFCKALLCDSTYKCKAKRTNLLAKLCFALATYGDARRFVTTCVPYGQVGHDARRFVLVHAIF